MHDSHVGHIFSLNQSATVSLYVMYFCIYIAKDKVKLHARPSHEGQEGGLRYRSIRSVTSTLDLGGWLTPRPGRFTLAKETRYPFDKWQCGHPGSVWKGTENLAPTGIRSPDRPARSKPLYRLRYLSPRIFHFLLAGQPPGGPWPPNSRGFLWFLEHTKRHTTVGRTPLDE